MSEKLLSNFMYYFFLPNVPSAYFSASCLPSIKYPLLFNNQTLNLFQNIIHQVQVLCYITSFALTGDYATEVWPVRWKQNYQMKQLKSLLLKRFNSA